MLELEEAVARILAVVPPVTTECVSLDNAHGRVLSERIVSPIDLPGFDNSAMDGYAVRAADVAPARRESAVRLRGAGGKVGGGKLFRGGGGRRRRRVFFWLRSPRRGRGGGGR